MDKQREIKELAAFLGKPPSKCGTEQCIKDCYNCIADSIVNRGYGDTKQAVREFAEYLKDYARQVRENGYDGIGEIDIDEKLNEFLEENK